MTGSRDASGHDPGELQRLFDASSFDLLGGCEPPPNGLVAAIVRRVQLTLNDAQGGFEASVVRPPDSRGEEAQ